MIFRDFTQNVFKHSVIFFKGQAWVDVLVLEGVMVVPGEFGHSLQVAFILRWVRIGDF